MGRVASYSQSSNISQLYNKLLITANKNDLLDSSLGFCFFTETNNLKNTLNPILVNKGKYITNQNKVYDNIDSAVYSYYGSKGSVLFKERIMMRKISS